jgi:hypothetical protein
MLHYVLKAIRAKRPSLLEDHAKLEYYARTVLDAGIEHLKREARTMEKDLEQPSLVQFYMNLFWFIEDLPEDVGFSDAMFMNALEAGIEFTRTFNNYRANHALSSLIRALDRSVLSDRERFRACADALLDIGLRASQMKSDKPESEEEETDNKYPTTVGEFVYHFRYQYNSIHLQRAFLQDPEELADRYKTEPLSSTYKMMAALISRLPKDALADGKTIKQYGDILLAFRKKDTGTLRDDLFVFIAKHIGALPCCVIGDMLAFKIVLDTIAPPIRSEKADHMDEDYEFNYIKTELFLTSLPGLINRLPKEVISDRKKLCKIIRICGRIFMTFKVDRYESLSYESRRELDKKIEHLRSGLAAFLETAARSRTDPEDFEADSLVCIGVLSDVFNVTLGPDEISCNFHELTEKLVETLRRIHIDSSNLHKFLMLPAPFLNELNAGGVLFDVLDIPDLTLDRSAPITIETIDKIRDALSSRRSVEWQIRHDKEVKEQESYVPAQSLADVAAGPLAWMVMAGGNPVARMINYMANSYYFGQGPLWQPGNIGGVRHRISKILAEKGLKVDWIKEPGKWNTTRRDIIRDDKDRLYMGYKDAGEILGRLQKPAPLPPELECWLKGENYTSERLIETVREIGWQGIKKGVSSDTLVIMIKLLIATARNPWNVSPDTLKQMGKMLFEAVSTADASCPRLKGARGLLSFLHENTRFKELGGVERLKNYIGIWMKIARITHQTESCKYRERSLVEIVSLMLKKTHEESAGKDNFALMNRCVDSLLSVIEAAINKKWDKRSIFGSRDNNRLMAMVSKFVEDLHEEGIYGSSYPTPPDYGQAVCHLLDKTARMINNGWKISKLKPLICFESQLLDEIPEETAADIKKIDSLIDSFMRFMIEAEKDEQHPLHPEHQYDTLERAIKAMEPCYFTDPERFKEALDFLSGPHDTSTREMFLEVFKKWRKDSLPDSEQMRIIIGAIQNFTRTYSKGEVRVAGYIDADSVAKFIVELPKSVWHNNASLVAVLDAAVRYVRCPLLSNYLDYLRFFLSALNERQLQPDMIKGLFDLSSEKDAETIRNAMLSYSKIAGDLKADITFEDSDFTPAALDARITVELKRTLENLVITQDILKVLKDMPADQLKEAGVIEKVVRYLKLEELVPDFSENALYSNEAGFISAAIKLAEQWTEMREDKNVAHIFEVSKKYGSISGYYRAERQPELDMLAKAGFDVEYLLSGKEVLARELGKNSTTTDGDVKWDDKYIQLMRRILGTITSKPERYYGFNRTPRKLAQQLNHLPNGRWQFLRAKEGDAEAAKEVINVLLTLVKKDRASEKETGRARILEDWHDRLSGLIGMIEQEKKDLFVKGIRAVRSNKHVPEIFFDNHRLGCCIFWPDGGDKAEIGRIVLDPQTPLLEIWPNGGGEFMGVATQYLGTNKAGEPVVFIDTMELSHSLYNMFGRSFVHRFVLEATVLDAYQMGARELAVYKCGYGTSAEFISLFNDLPEMGGVKRDVVEYHFKAVDVEDSAHHYTDAFGHNKALWGKANCFVIDVKKYVEQVLKDKI